MLAGQQPQLLRPSPAPVAGTKTQLVPAAGPGDTYSPGLTPVAGLLGVPAGHPSNWQPEHRPQGPDRCAPESCGTPAPGTESPTHTSCQHQGPTGCPHPPSLTPVADIVSTLTSSWHSLHSRSLQHPNPNGIESDFKQKGHEKRC